MKLRKIFESQFEQQRAEIARQALAQALRGGLPATTKMKDILAELKEDPILWQAFEDMRFDDLRKALVPPTDAYGPPGPTRRRGVTLNRIIAYVRENPGARRSDIMKALGLKGGTVSSQLRGLRASGQLRGEGPERNLRYFVG